MRQRFILLCSCVMFMIAGPAHALVITEIMYNQPGTEETLEFVEIYNEKAAPEDLSGYRINAGWNHQKTSANISYGDTERD